MDDIGLDDPASENEKESGAEEDKPLRADAKSTGDKPQTFSKSQVQAGKSLVKDEVRDQGAVSWRTIKSYVMAAGGYPLVIFVIVFLLMANLARTFTEAWLSYWINEGDGEVSFLKCLA